MKRFLTVPCAALAVACAGGAGGPNGGGPAIPELDLTVSRTELLNAAHEKYPVADFLVGYGAGESPEAAENYAVADCAGLIKSEVKANIHSIETEWNGRGEALTANEVAVKVTSDAGAIIRPVREMT